MIINRLVAKQIATLPKGLHSDGGNLYLSVRDGGSRQWVMRYRFGGRQRELGLGGAGPGGMPLAEARLRAERIRSQLRSKVDPLEGRATQEAASFGKAIPTFRVMADEHIDRATSSWKSPKSPAQWRASLCTHAASIQDMLVSEIDVDDVIAVLDPIWYRLPETAKRVRGRIEAILSLAKTRGFCNGENPAAWRNNLSNVFHPKPKLVRGHFASIEYDEAPAFIRGLRERNSMSSLVNEWVILTVTRATPAVEARWGQIDLVRRTWTVSAELMKSGKEQAALGEPHVVPLSVRAMDILGLVSPLRVSGEADELIFPSEQLRPLSLTSLDHCRERMGVQTTTHGFRSTFRTWAAEETFHEHEICEKALAHLVGDEVHRAYQRGALLEKRRVLMDDWCAFLNGSLSPEVNPFVRQGPLVPTHVMKELQLRRSARR